MRACVTSTWAMSNAYDCTGRTPARHIGRRAQEGETDQFTEGLFCLKGPVSEPGYTELKSIGVNRVNML
jgi:hypothetical protein